MNGSNDLNLATYSLISLADKNSMKHIFFIMEQNTFIEEMAIVTIQEINHEKEDEVKYLFSKSLRFTGMERSRK